MERMRSVTPDGQHFSAGIAQWTGAESATQLIARADGALYVAKREGRDRVTFTGDPESTALTGSYSDAGARWAAAPATGLRAGDLHDYIRSER